MNYTIEAPRTRARETAAPAREQITCEACGGSTFMLEHRRKRFWRPERLVAKCGQCERLERYPMGVVIAHARDYRTYNLFWRA